MTTGAARELLSLFERDPSGWTDAQINEHPFVELGWGEIPVEQVEEVRLVQLEQLRRLQVAGILPDYAEDAEDLELLIEITADSTRFARVCANWRWALDNRPRRLELPPGCTTYEEAFKVWFAGS